MKKITGFIFLCILSFSLLAFKLPGTFNRNSWRISIGKKDVFTSQKNPLGDVVNIRKASIKDSDTLSAYMYFCGSMLDRATCTVIIADEHGNTLRGAPSKHLSISFSGSIPVRTLFSDENFKKATILNISLDIKSPLKDGIHQTYLIGKLQFI